MDIGSGIAVVGVAASVMGTVAAVVWRLFPDRNRSNEKVLEHLTSELAIARTRLDEEKNTNLWGTISDLKKVLEKMDQRIDMLERILIQVTTACQMCSSSSPPVGAELRKTGN